MAVYEQAIDRHYLYVCPVGRIVDDYHDDRQINGRTLDVIDPRKVVHHCLSGPEQARKAFIHLSDDCAACNQRPIGAHAGHAQVPNVRPVLILPDVDKYRIGSVAHGRIISFRNDRTSVWKACAFVSRILYFSIR